MCAHPSLHGHWYHYVDTLPEGEERKGGGGGGGVRREEGMRKVSRKGRERGEKARERERER